MNSTFKRLVSMMLVLCMVLVAFAACTPADDDGEGTGDGTGTNEPGSDVVEAKVGNYTYRSYTTALGNNWCPHSWEVNADDAILSYVSSPFCTMQALDTENGIYQWVYEMAESVTDVTKANQADLTKYNVTLQEGKTAETTEAGYVFEIKLNPNAKWQNGEAITADDYIYSMKALLDPKMKNYRANLYYAGESAVAGGAEYFNSGSPIYTAMVPAYESDPDYSYDLAAGLAAGHVYLNVSTTDMTLAAYTLSELVNTYGAPGADQLKVIGDAANIYGYTLITEENLADAKALVGACLAPFGMDWSAMSAEEQDQLFMEACFVNDGSVSEVYDYDVVGCYKVDDYTIRYVNDVYIDLNYFLTSCTSTWLVYEEYYEAGKDTSGELVTTDYNSKVENTMSYGPYKIESLQNDKQIVYVQNENWYGYEKEGDYLVSWTPYEVDGASRQRYMTTKIIVDVMDDEAAKLAFLKGDLDDWAPSADDLTTYAMSEQLYKVDETYTMSFFFNTGVAALQEMDNSKGNTNSVVLSNYNFRKAFSLAVDREEFVTATQGYKPAYAIMNNLYHYDVYNDPKSSYRSSDAAMQAICNLYNVSYGEGTPYATLKEAYESINGYNLTEAKELMKTACQELVAEGLYKEGDPIHIRIGWAKAALTTADNNQGELFNKYINAAAEGSGFGKITLELIGSIEDRYADVPAGEYAIGYGAWGGAAFYPFRNFQVYCDTEQYAGQINEMGCWDPATEEHTIVVDGEEVTMTWQEWSRALIGTGKFTEADFQTKLEITANLEENFLKKYYRIPLAGSTACSMLSYKMNYYTEEYNIMYGFGGLELLTYNYTDEEWTEYIASLDGQLSYE